MVRDSVPLGDFCCVNFSLKSIKDCVGIAMGKRVEVKISQLIKQHNISYRELSRLTDIRHSALIELANQQRQNINFSHIERIAESLNIKDIREIITIKETNE